EIDRVLLIEHGEGVMRQGDAAHCKKRRTYQECLYMGSHSISPVGLLIDVVPEAWLSAKARQTSAHHYACKSNALYSRCARPAAGKADCRVEMGLRHVPFLAVVEHMYITKA